MDICLTYYILLNSFLSGIWSNLRPKKSRGGGKSPPPVSLGPMIKKTEGKLFRVKVREGRIAEITEILAWYEYINDVILDHLDDNIKSTDISGVWRYLISFKVKSY